VIVVSMLLVGLLAPWIAPYDPFEGAILQARQPPSPEHLFGTDQLGRDVLSRVEHGALISLRAAAVVVAIAIAVGLPIGLVSGYLGGTVDLATQRVVDAMMAFPGVLLAVLIVSVLGATLETTIIAIAIVAIPSYVRLARGSVLVERERDYVLAARALGFRSPRIVVFHVLPNAVLPVLAQAGLTFAFAVTAVAGLSFIGLGARPPTPEWGAMMSQGFEYVRTTPHMVIFPAIAISIAVLGLNLLSDALRDEISLSHR
jgi:ABC-type dipeptide/oligopeptide/nickel transport system permease subunit